MRHEVSHYIVYDRQSAGNVGGLGWEERVAACYRWADSSRPGVRDAVRDEVIAWDADAGQSLPVELLGALAYCERLYAALLVYDVECISASTSRVREVVDRFGANGLPVYSVRQGQITPEGLDADASGTTSTIRGGDS
jgi:hypothetical protein